MFCWSLLFEEHSEKALNYFKDFGKRLEICLKIHLRDFGKSLI